MQDITRRNFALATLGIGMAAFAKPSAAEVNGIGKRMLAAVPGHGEKALGDPNAPVTIIEYASATCVHCAEFHNKVWPKIKKDYVDTGKAYYIFRELMTDDLSLGAFMLMRCVPPENYFQAIAQMFEEQSDWARKNPKDGLFKIAAAAGLDTAGAEACIKNEELARSIVETGNRAKTEFKINVTPAIFVNGFFTPEHKDAKKLAAFVDRFLPSN